MAEEDFTVTVDGLDYKVGDLESDDQQVVAHLRDLDNQLGQVNFRFEQLSAAKAAFSDKLVASLSQKRAEKEEAEKASAASADSSDAPAEASADASQDSDS